MPVDRTKGKRTENSQAGPSRLKRPQSTDVNATPGVSKLKAALRQTRRLLAKEKLDANVRVEGERRLKALEVQLAQAETAKKEKDMATRYHRIKFFDRQKVVRKIHQAKKQLAEAIDDEAKAPLKAALRECRVKLNYILHYPRTEKYISLFPPEVREAGPSNAPHVSNPAQETILSDIRRQMDDGSLPDEPEMHLEKSARKQTSGQHAKALPSLTKMSVPEARHLKPKTFQSVAQDDFFGEDTDGNDEDDG